MTAEREKLNDEVAGRNTLTPYSDIHHTYSKDLSELELEHGLKGALEHTTKTRTSGQLVLSDCGPLLVESLIQEAQKPGRQLSLYLTASANDSTC